MNLKCFYTNMENEIYITIFQTFPGFNVFDARQIATYFKPLIQL